MPSGNILLLFHCASHTGYAIATLERIFDRAARSLLDEGSAVHYAYSDITRGRPDHLSDQVSDVTAVSYYDPPDKLARFGNWVAARGIERVLAFDLPVKAPITATLRKAGVTRIVSYWGASISDVYPALLRPLRRLQFLLTSARPDHFVFESEGMRDRGTLGAGIPLSKTSVCYIGVDCSRFMPVPGSTYAHEQFDIPRDRRLVFFSGHMEERKGVHILIDAFASVSDQTRTRLHLLLAGNTTEDEERLRARVANTPAASHITFAGYRRDVPLLQQSASLGVIASTGWDSFTVSAVEMAATALPLVVSDLPGLREAVVPGVTGERVPVGDVAALATTIERLMNDDALRSRYGSAGRERVLREFSDERQIQRVAECLRG